MAYSCVLYRFPCSNVLLSEDCRASVADLGLARAADGSNTGGTGHSLQYAAPEQLLGERCTFAADMYSYGILLIEITTRSVVDKRGEWRLPIASQECPLVSPCFSQLLGEC